MGARLFNQIDSSTIDGNVEFVHSQCCCILTSQVSTQFLCLTKLLKKCDNFRLSAYYSEISANLCVFYFLFLHFFVFLVIFDTIVTSCIIVPFLCCHILYLIIYLKILKQNKKLPPLHHVQYHTQ